MMQEFTNKKGGLTEKFIANFVDNMADEEVNKEEIAEIKQEAEAEI